MTKSVGDQVIDKTVGIQLRRSLLGPRWRREPEFQTLIFGQKNHPTTRTIHAVVELSRGWDDLEIPATTGFPICGKQRFSLSNTRSAKNHVIADIFRAHWRLLPNTDHTASTSQGVSVWQPTVYNHRGSRGKYLFSSFSFLLRFQLGLPFVHSLLVEPSPLDRIST